MNDAQDAAAIAAIAEGVEKAGFTFGKDIAIALDTASTEFYKDGLYQLEGKGRSAEEMVAIFEKLIADYPIRKNGECPHFYTFLHNICNFLTGRCWVLTPFLEVGARAFGITFA